VKAGIRRALYEVFAQAIRSCGLSSRQHDPLVDRGDGIMMLVRPLDRVPKTLLLGEFLPALERALARHNGRRSDLAFRLRIAVHAGEVHYDRRGPFGAAVDFTCRLLDAEGLRAALRRASGPTALAVSDHLYQSIVSHRYDGIDPTFHPLAAFVLAGHTQRGWVNVAEGPARAPRGSERLTVLPGYDVGPGVRAGREIA
jgi:class 3 adenylate cyclase